MLLYVGIFCPLGHFLTSADLNITLAKLAVLSLIDIQLLEQVSDQ